MPLFLIGADAHGAVLTKVFKVVLRDVTIDHLNAGDGHAVGLDLIGDEVGRALFFPANEPYVTTDNVVVGGDLRGGEPGFVTGIKLNKQASKAGNPLMSQVSLYPRPFSKPFSVPSITSCIGSFFLLQFVNFGGLRSSEGGNLEVWKDGVSDALLGCHWCGATTRTPNLSPFTNLHTPQNNWLPAWSSVIIEAETVQASSTTENTKDYDFSTPDNPKPEDTNGYRDVGSFFPFDIGDLGEVGWAEKRYTRLFDFNTGELKDQVCQGIEGAVGSLILLSLLLTGRLRLAQSALPWQVLFDQDALDHIMNYFGVDIPGRLELVRDVGFFIVRSVCGRDFLCTGPFGNEAERGEQSLVQHFYFTLPVYPDTELTGTFIGDFNKQRLPDTTYEIRVGAYYISNLYKEGDSFFYYWSKAPEMVLSDTYPLPYVRSLNYIIWANGFGYGKQQETLAI